MAIIGSAEVVIRAITKGIAADIKRGLKEAQPAVRSAGEDAGTAYGDGFTRGSRDRLRTGIHSAVDQAGSGMDRHGDDHGSEYSAGFLNAVTRQIPNAVNTAFNRAGGGANASNAGNNAATRYTKSVKQRIREEMARGFRNPFDAAFSGFEGSGNKHARAYMRGFLTGFDPNKITGLGQRAMAGFGKFMGGGFDASIKASRQAFLSMYSTMSLIGPAIATIIGALGSLAGGLFVVAGAAAQAAGALMAVPVGIMALAQGAIVASQASKGVTAAIKAMTAAKEEDVEASGASSDASDQMAAKASAIADAQKNLARVQEDNADRIAEANDRIKEAQDEVGETAKENADRLADANQRVLDSEQELVDAKQELRDAQLALNQAYQEGAESLQQLNFDAEDAALAEEEAGIRLRRARDEMLKTQSDTGASAIDRQEAELSYKQAELNYRRQKDRAQDLAKEQDKANKAGVAGTKEVQDANENVADARENEADAAKDVKEAEQDLQDVREQNAKAMADALDKVADAQDNLLDVQRQNARALEDANEALAKANAMQIASADAAQTATAAQKKLSKALEGLGENQRSFAEAVVESRSAWKEFRSSMGERMFEGAAESWKTFTESFVGTGDHIPQIRKDLEDTAGIMGQYGKQFLGLFTEGSEGSKLFSKMLKGNNRLLETFTRKGADGQSAFESLGIVIMRVVTAAQPMVQRFAEYLAGVVRGWEDSTKEGSTGSKKLMKFFEDAGDAAAKWGEIFGNFWDGIKNMFDASKESRDEFMDDLLGLSERFRDLTDRMNRDGSMAKWFQGAYDNSKAIMGFLGEIGDAIIKVGDDPAIGKSFRTMSEGLSEDLQGLLQPFLDAGPQLAELFRTIGSIIKALTSGQGLQIFLETLTKVFDATAKFLSLDGVQAVLQFMAPIAAVLAAMRLTLGIYRQLGAPIAALLVGSRKLMEYLVVAAQKVGILQRTPPPPVPTPTPVPTPIVTSTGGGTGIAPIVAPPPPVSKWAKFGGVLKSVGRAVLPVGIAIGVAALAFELFSGGADEATESTDEFIQKNKEMVDALDPVTGAITDQTRLLQIQKDAADGTLKSIEDLGIETGVWESASLGNAKAQEELANQVNQLSSEVITGSPAWQDWSDDLTQLGITTDDLTAAIAGGEQGWIDLSGKIGMANGKLGENAKSQTELDAILRGTQNIILQSSEGVGKYTDAQQKAIDRAKNYKSVGETVATATRLAGEVTEETTEKVDTLGTTFKDAVPKVASYKDITEQVTEANSDFDEIVDQVRAGLDLLAGRAPQYSEAMATYGEDLEGLKKKFKDAETGAVDFDKAAVTASGGINFMIEDGRELDTTLKDMRDSTIAAATAAFEQAGGVNNLKEAQAAATKVINESNSGMEAFIKSLGLGPAKTAALIDALGNVPTSVVTDIEISSEQASRDLDKFVYDETTGQIIGVKVQADTTVAEEDLENWELDVNGKPLYRKVDADTTLAEGEMLTFQTNAEGDVIGLKAEVDPKSAANTLVTFRSAESKKPVKLLLTPDMQAMIQGRKDLETDAQKNPIIYNTVIGKDANGNDVVDQYVKTKNGKEISLGISTTVTTTAGPPNLAKLKGNKFIMQPMATGGFVSGPGGPTDDKVPRWLSNGEYVIKAKMVRKYGRRVLDLLNRGLIPPGMDLNELSIKNSRLVPRKNMRAVSGTATTATREFMSSVMSSALVSNAGNTYVVTSATSPVEGIQPEWIAQSMIPWVPKFESSIDTFNADQQLAWDDTITALNTFFAAISSLVKGPGIFVPNAAGAPPANMSGDAANTTDAKLAVYGNFPAIDSIGTWRAAGSVPGSDHPRGKALDVMIPDYKSAAGIALGNQIANFFMKNSSRFKTKYIIWRDQITQGGGWEPYSHPSGNDDNLQHRNHVHISLFDKGGLLQNAGFGINLSGRPERVLSPAQTVAFDRLVNVITQNNAGASAQTGMGRDDGGLSSRERQMISAIASGVAAQQNSMMPTVRVFIGDQELRGMITSELLAYDQSAARVISLGRKP